jgi:hypothetical protein
MKFDFGLERLWSQKNKELQNSIAGLGPLAAVRAYPGITIGLSEVVRGLVRLFPHRRTFAVVRGCGPFFDELLDFLSMEGLLRTDLTVADLKTPDELIKKIPKDTAFVLGSYDDPLTGEIFGYDGVFPALHQNRTFTVALSHSLHAARGFPQMSPYMAVISKMPGQGAFGLFGQRASKIPPLAPGPSDWFSPTVGAGSLQGGSLQKVIEGRHEVLDFERKLPQGFAPFFDQDVPRVYDRAVVRALEFDGDACIRLLAEELKIKVAEAGLDSRLETLSLCRWQGVNTFNWYTDQGRRLQDLRGVFMVDRALLGPVTLRALERAGERLRELQS